MTEQDDLCPICGESLDSGETEYMGEIQEVHVECNPERHGVGWSP